MFKQANQNTRPQRPSCLCGTRTRSFVLLAASFLGGFCAAIPAWGFQAPEISSQVKQAVTKANRLEKSGRMEEAIKVYGQAKEEAKTEMDRAEIVLETGLAKFRQAEVMNSTEVLKRAEEDFMRVIEMQAIAPQQATRAWNNLVPVYLEMKQPDKAKQAIEKCSADAFPKDKRFIYYYNLARVHAALDEPVKAVAEYQKAFTETPLFLQASEEAWKLANAENDDPKLSWALYNFGAAMIKDGQSVKARELAIQSAQEKRQPKHVEAMLCLVVRSLAFSTFKEDAVSEQLLQLKSREVFPARALDEIQAAFSKPFALEEVLSAEYDPERDFPWFTARERDGRLGYDFSLLLGNIGDFKIGIGLHPRERAWQPMGAEVALTHYLLAWDIAPRNFQAAQNAAWVLATCYGELKGGDQALDRMDKLTDRLFEAKTEFYARQGKTREDWERILRMHMLLGTIYEARKQWGSDETPKSAIFQWTLALRVEQQIREMANNSEYRSSGLHQRLAYAYQETKSYDKAFMHYLEAASAFSQHGEIESARKAINDAEKLPHDQSDAQKQRLRQVLDELNRTKSS